MFGINFSYKRYNTQYFFLKLKEKLFTLVIESGQWYILYGLESYPGKRKQKVRGHKFIFRMIKIITISSNVTGAITAVFCTH